MRALLDWLPMILSITAVVGVGGFLVLLGLWPVVSSFLVGTKFGRAISAAGAVVLAIWWVFIAGKRKGTKATKQRLKAANYKVVKERIKINETVGNMSRADRRRELSKWVRG